LVLANTYEAKKIRHYEKYLRISFSKVKVIK